MSRQALPQLSRCDEPDGSIVLECDDDQCQVSIRVRPDLFVDPRWRHILPKLFAVGIESGNEAAA